MKPSIWIGMGMLLGWCACGGEAAAELHRYEFQQPEMGVPFRIVLYAKDPSVARKAAEAAFARIAELNSLLSDYEDESELMRLSRSSGQGTPVAVAPDLWRVLQEAQSLAERSGGAFDITVGPLVQLWRRARRQRELPTPERMAEALSRSGYRLLELSAAHHTALLKVPGMRLDAGGIAKGYAVDEALQVLQAQGVSRALVAGAGDMAASGPPPGEKGWRIEVAPLDLSHAPPARVALLAHAGLATSGDIFQHVVLDGRRYSHIVDPRTGIGLTNSSLVTVIATNGITADSLATAVSVLGPAAGLQLIQETPGAEVYLVHPEGTTVRALQSPGWDRAERAELPLGAGAP